MKLSTKILLMCGAMLCGLCIVAGVALSALYDTMRAERIAQLTTLVELAHAASEKAHALEKSGALTTEQAQAKAKEVIGSFHKGDMYFFVRGYTNDINYVHPNPKRVGVMDKEGKQAGDRYRAALNGKVIGLVEAEGTRPGTTDKVTKLYAVIKFAPWDWTIGFGAYVDDINKLFWKYAITLLVIGSVLMLVILAVSWQMLRTILAQLGGEPAQTASIVNNIAKGDLATAVPLRPGDQSSLLYAIETMRVTLSSIVQKVRSGTDLIAMASAEIASGNNDLSARTEQQASSLQETTSSMEHLSSTVSQNADSARQANQLAMNASDVAARGGEVVNQVVDTTKGISDSSRKIADIISVIDGIAFQTNILALNAAVEAARAGEQGRGFAVVASEVRSLASRSADAAKQIKTLIDDSVERVEKGASLADQAGSTMAEVVSAIKRVTDLMGEISSASAEQSQGVSQVGQAVTQMDQTTQQNAALVEEMAAAASSLSKQAQHLVDTVAFFKVSADPADGSTPALTAY